MTNEKSVKKSDAPSAPAPSRPAGGMSGNAPQLMFLAAALLAGLVVYFPVLSAGWFYDDSDYVLLDPRMDHPELFLPWHWSDPPPSLERVGEPTLVIPGYEKPLIADRFLWHLSFALERRIFGLKPSVSHGVNLALHLSCVAMLFLALTNLLRLYYPDEPPESSPSPESTRAPPGAWRFLPGVAALFFAVLPWASEPVCYVSARNGSMGALFTLAGLWCWTQLFLPRRSVPVKALAAFGALLCALAAYGSKENFIAASAGYVLATAPLIWQRFKSWPRPTLIGLFAGIGVLIAVVAWIGIQKSDRASGLFAQAAGGNGWTYLFEIQSPILLMTLLDEVLGRRVSLETNFPNWSVAACWAGIIANVALLTWGVVRGWRKPVWLGLAWFYLFLIPSNSFLPRPDFLAGRNVYLPSAGAAVLLAGLIVWWIGRIFATSEKNTPGRPNMFGLVLPITLGASLCLYFAITTNAWAEMFDNPIEVWEHSAAVAPDHAVVRLNFAVELFKSENPNDRKRSEPELLAAIAAEDSPTMRYHTSRPKAMARSIAYQLLAELRQTEQRPREAEEFYRQSWLVMPTVTTWIQWINVCDTNTIDFAESEGFREWPNAWWTAAFRGLRRLHEHGNRMSSEILDDLQGAERVPNSTEASLRPLQAEALGHLAEATSDRVHVGRLLDRIAALGVSGEALDKLRERLLGSEKQ